MLSQILLPIKTAIIILESDKATLADVFIQLIKLAYRLKHLKMNNFKKYAIEVFNKRWETFEIEIYLLAYFLHPGYKG
jgi:hypothetical protein